MFSFFPPAAPKRYWTVTSKPRFCLCTVTPILKLNAFQTYIYSTGMLSGLGLQRGGTFLVNVRRLSKKPKKIRKKIPESFQNVQEIVPHFATLIRISTSINSLLSVCLMVNAVLWCTVKSSRRLIPILFIADSNSCCHWNRWWLCLINDTHWS